MATTLSSLIEEVEAHSPSGEPLELLATAAATVDEVTDAADACLSHFVDRSRRAGHSWTEIGTALGVTKQAVRKRFTPDKRALVDLDGFTDRARAVVSTHAFTAADELGTNYIGTEHLLVAMWGEPAGIAAKALKAAGLTRAKVVQAIDARVERGTQGPGGFTPRAGVAIGNAPKVAAQMGHDYVGTEHLLLALMSGVGGMAEEILVEAGLSEQTLRGLVVKELSGYARKM